MIPGTEDPKAEWPPAWMAPIMARYEIWAAWHSGDPDKLAAVYSGSESDSSGFFASESGGFKARVKRLVSNVVRYFWGQRSNGKPRRRLHDPIAGDIASASADLLFAEPVAAKAVNADGEPNEEAQKVLDAIMDEGAQAALLEGGETAAALSGAFVRARWDTDVSEHPWFDIIAPDCAVPYWNGGRLWEVTLWKVLARKGQDVFRHLEHHRKGEVEHALYKGTDEAIGVPVALDALPELAGLASEIDENGVIKGKSERLGVEYAPNMRPNKIWRDIPQAAHLGVSDFSGIEGLLDANDLAYSSLIRDVDLGKSRLLVPKSYLNDHGRGQGASFDYDRELYEPVNASQDEDKGMQIEMVQFEIRVEDHERVLQMLKSDAVTRAGYSPQTFGLAGEVAITATEVAAKERRSLTTRSRKMKYWAPALRGILTTLLEIAGHTGVEVTLEWPDAVSVDPTTQSEKVMNWRTAEIASMETAIKEIHPDWDDDAVKDEIERIKEEAKEMAPEPPDEFAFGQPGEEQAEAKAEMKPEELEAVA